jgi:hypothetical protein
MVTSTLIKHQDWLIASGLGSLGAHLYDVENFNDICLLYETQNSALTVAESQGVLYGATISEPLSIYNLNVLETPVDCPETPVTIEPHSTFELDSGLSLMWWLKSDGDELFQNTRLGPQGIDITTPLSPQLDLPPIHTLEQLQAEDRTYNLSFYGNIMFAPIKNNSHGDRLALIQIEPDDLTTLSLTDEISGMQIEKEDQYLFFQHYAFETTRKYVVNFADPVEPEFFIPTWPANSGNELAAIRAPYLFTKGGTSIHLIDISDVSNTTLAQSISLKTGTAQDLYLHGDRLYVARGSNGIEIFNVSDMTQPTSEFELSLTHNSSPASADIIFSDADHIYVFDRTTQSDSDNHILLILNQPAATAPEQVAAFEIGTEFESAELKNNYIYFFATDPNVVYGSHARVIDISNINNIRMGLKFQPFELTSDYFNHSSVYNDYIYFGTFNHGIIGYPLCP